MCDEFGAVDFFCRLQGLRNSSDDATLCSRNFFKADFSRVRDRATPPNMILCWMLPLVGQAAKAEPPPHLIVAVHAQNTETL